MVVRWLFGASGTECLGKPSIHEELEDVVAVITSTCIGLILRPELLATVRPQLSPDVTVYAPLADDADDWEEFKVRAFVRMVEEFTSVAAPVASPFDLEGWPLVMAFALEGVGPGGFLTMTRPVTDATEDLMRAIATPDEYAVDYLTNCGKYLLGGLGDACCEVGAFLETKPDDVVAGVAKIAWTHRAIYNHCRSVSPFTFPSPPTPPNSVTTHTSDETGVIVVNVTVSHPTAPVEVGQPMVISTNGWGCPHATAVITAASHLQAAITEDDPAAALIASIEAAYPDNLEAVRGSVAVTHTSRDLRQVEMEDAVVTRTVTCTFLDLELTASTVVSPVAVPLPPVPLLHSSPSKVPAFRITSCPVRDLRSTQPLSCTLTYPAPWNMVTPGRFALGAAGLAVYQRHTRVRVVNPTDMAFSQKVGILSVAVKHDTPFIISLNATTIAGRELLAAGTDWGLGCEHIYVDDESVAHADQSHPGLQPVAASYVAGPTVIRHMHMLMPAGEAPEDDDDDTEINEA